ncbi:MAG: hypothetical protein PUF65_11455 [Lachnospiraceae bacterium]|nr:hypothetical protein [Lachnospiraceae bacterium]
MVAAFKLKQHRYFLTALVFSMILLEYSYYSTMAFGYENAGNTVELFLYTLGSGLASWLGILFPMVAALPYATSYVQEYKTGYLKCEFLRERKSIYIVQKLILAFVYGGAALGIPVGLYALQIGLTHKTEVSLESMEGQRFVSYLPNIAEQNEAGYMAMSVGFVFLCGAAFSVFALGISAWVKNEFLTILLPFAICVLIAIVSPVGWFNLLLLFCPSEYSLIETWQLAVMWMGLMAVGIFLFVSGVKYNEKE